MMPTDGRNKYSPDRRDKHRHYERKLSDAKSNRSREERDRHEPRHALRDNRASKRSRSPSSAKRQDLALPPPPPLPPQHATPSKVGAPKVGATGVSNSFVQELIKQGKNLMGDRNKTSEQVSPDDYDDRYEHVEKKLKSLSPLSKTPPKGTADGTRGTAFVSATKQMALELLQFREKQADYAYEGGAVALKPSPDVSEEGERKDDNQVMDNRRNGSRAVSNDSDDEMNLLGVTSRWADVVDDDEAPQGDANGDGAGGDDLAGPAKLYGGEQRPLSPSGSDDSMSPSTSEEGVGVNATGRVCHMLAECRRVEEFEKQLRISEGTYGVVFKAREIKTDRTCALKRLKLEKERDGFPLTSLREINIMLNLQHPNIVAVNEVVVGKSMDQVYMVMEYMDHDLRHLMDSNQDRPFSISEVKCLMLQLLDGIHFLHSNWVIHRDLKTSNILYNNKGELKICDFGLSRQYGSPLRPYTQPVVTLWYRAPELMFGEKLYSTPIDMWSAGCIMAELILGKPLLQGKGDIDQINQMVSILGTPNEENWPGFSKLPNAANLKLKQLPSTLRQKFRQPTGRTLTEAGIELLSGLLAYDPKRRLTAEEALHHRWFTESPFPQKKDLMPSLFKGVRKDETAPKAKPIRQLTPVHNSPTGH